VENKVRISTEEFRVDHISWSKLFRRKLFSRPGKSRFLADDERLRIMRTRTCPYCDGPLYARLEKDKIVNFLCRTEGCNSCFHITVRPKVGASGKYVGVFHDPQGSKFSMSASLKNRANKYD
jgi:hypothetical protein